MQIISYMHIKINKKAAITIESRYIYLMYVSEGHSNYQE